MYYLYFIENNKENLYGSGDMSYIMELIDDYLQVHKMYNREQVKFKVSTKAQIKKDNVKGKDDIQMVKYSDEELDLIRIMYTSGYKITTIPQILNERFHDGKEVRTYCGIKDCIRRNKISAKKPPRKSGELYYCKTCKDYKDKFEFVLRSDYAEGVSTVCKKCMNDYQREYKRKREMQYRKRLGEVKVVCQHCYKYLGIIPITEEGSEEKKVLKPVTNVNIVLNTDGELGVVNCTCGKDIDLNKYYENWFK